MVNGSVSELADTGENKTLFIFLNCLRLWTQQVKKEQVWYWTQL